MDLTGRRTAIRRYASLDGVSLRTDLGDSFEKTLGAAHSITPLNWVVCRVIVRGQRVTILAGRAVDRQKWDDLYLECAS